MKWDFLIQWFEENQRSMPWRELRDPYRVWVSEIMLQQTQVQTVIPYFKKWMEHFPSVEHLAKAKQEEVIKVWEGLGYYSRARNMHEAAKTLVKEQNGIFPHTLEELLKIKGIGPYTAAAIVSFAFKGKAATVDGNVLRVLSRLWEVSEEITAAKTQSDLRKRLYEVLPNQDAWIVSEALIELGATTCTPKKPKCSQCPLQQNCQAFKNQSAENYPKRKPRVKAEPLYRSVAMIYHSGHWLLRENEKGKIMEDLWEFPYKELSDPWPSHENDHSYFEDYYQLSLKKVLHLDPIVHKFTKYSVTLFPSVYTSDQVTQNLGKSSSKLYRWIPIKDLHTLPMTGGHRELRKSLEKIQLHDKIVP